MGRKIWHRCKDRRSLNSEKTQAMEAELRAGMDLVEEFKERLNIESIDTDGVDANPLHNVILEMKVCIII